MKNQLLPEGFRDSLPELATKENKVNSALIICDLDDEKNKSLVLSARNIKNVKIIDAKAVNCYDLLRYEKIFTDEKTFEEKIIKSI